eukprot:2499289-Pyramimonas_sp.AAC.1
MRIRILSQQGRGPRRSSPGNRPKIGSHFRQWQRPRLRSPRRPKRDGGRGRRRARGERDEVPRRTPQDNRGAHRGEGVILQ